MEYQKIINLLDNIQNEPSTFRTRNWVEINDESPETCSKYLTKLNWNLQLQSQIYVIIKMHIY